MPPCKAQGSYSGGPHCSLNRCAAEQWCVNQPRDVDSYFRHTLEYDVLQVSHGKQSCTTNSPAPQPSSVYQSSYSSIRFFSKCYTSLYPKAKNRHGLVHNLTCLYHQKATDFRHTEEC